MYSKHILAPVYLQLVFEATVGRGFQSDVAIDDVQISSGACGTPGSCDFEVDTCTWANTPVGDDFDWLRGMGTTRSSFTGPQYDHTKANTFGNFYP